MMFGFRLMRKIGLNSGLGHIFRKLNRQEENEDDTLTIVNLTGLEDSEKSEVVGALEGSESGFVGDDDENEITPPPSPLPIHGEGEQPSRPNWGKLGDFAFGCW